MGKPAFVSKDRQLMAKTSHDDEWRGGTVIVFGNGLIRIKREQM